MQKSVISIKKAGQTRVHLSGTVKPYIFYRYVFVSLLALEAQDGLKH